MPAARRHTFLRVVDKKNVLSLMLNILSDFLLTGPSNNMLSVFWYIITLSYTKNRVL